jgi:predicted DNA binding protein
MSVIVALSLPADEFELGRILDIQDDASVVLETMVPLGGRSIPFFRRFDGMGETFEAAISDHPAVDDIHVVSSHDGETLYALDWVISDDSFFDGIQQADAHVLEATGTARTWSFELRFPTHESLSAFREYCVGVDIPIDIKRVFNPTRPDAGPWFGLTGPQRAMLTRAVEAGYYSIPRQTSTKTLAEEFDISDQAVTERLRRAIDTLVTNTLDVADETE